MSGMAFGKIITEQSYHNGRVSVVTTRYQVPELVKDKSQAMTVILKALELIVNKQTTSVTIKVDSNPKNHQFRLVTRTYVVETKRDVSP